MAVVNVDLSEYDAIRNRNKELEEQVKELKKLNESLKSNAKVILRKETVVKSFDYERISNPYFDELGHYNEGVRPKQTKIVESSESYINFEDVRLKVENQMRKEVEDSIKANKAAYEKYLEKYSLLDADFQKKSKELDKKKEELEESNKKKLEEENAKLRDEYKGKFAESERKRNQLTLCLKQINILADKVNVYLGSRFFVSSAAIEQVKRIMEISSNKEV